MSQHASEPPEDAALDRYDRAVQRAASAVRAYSNGRGHDPAAVLEHLDAALQAGFDVLEPTPEIADPRD
jgi:hypothetical protein